MSFDADGQDPVTATRMIVNDFLTYMENMKKARIPAPPGSSREVIEKLERADYLNNFHAKLNDGVVQADFSFSGTVVQGTTVNTAGDTWRLKFTIDADVPPTKSSQKPHFGYEISVDGTKKQVAYKWLPKLTIGRPAPGIKLIEAGGEKGDKTLSNSDTIKWEFQYWKLPKT